MNHFLLLIVCILSIEIFVRLNFLSLFDSILKVTKKVTYIIPKSNISDHWKEKIIPVYAALIMKYSLQVLLILLLILSLFFITNFFHNNFLAFTFSLIGIIESVVFASLYLCLRRSFIKWIIILFYKKNCINLHSTLNLWGRLCLILKVL